MKSKGAQMTIFIIVGLVIVTGVVLFFLLKGSETPSLLGVGSTVNFNSFLQQCLEKDLRETVNLVMAQGGYVENPLHIEFKFEGEPTTNISYLCYTEENYLPCINHEPVLMGHIKKEIHEELKEEVKKCFENFKKTLEKAGNEFEGKYNGFEVELKPNQVLIKLDADISVEKSGESVKQKNIGVIYPTKIYSLVNVAKEIVGQEAQYCNFEHIGYSLLYPEFDIDRFRTSSLSTIYTIENKKTEEKFRFAIKSCTIPPGLV